MLRQYEKTDYTGKCPMGHNFAVKTQTLPHEMLFEIALNAISDKYHREAISSFAASIVRYYEFAIRVLGKNYKFVTTIFDLARKVVTRQSERQLGAYVLLYVTRFGEMPRILSNPMTEFRNDVIHRGMLPDKQTTLRLGEETYDIIQTGISKLRDACEYDINHQLAEYVAGTVTKQGGQFPLNYTGQPYGA